MNSERRHELQHNLLADYLGQWVRKIEPYAKQIAVVFTAIVVAVVAWGVMQSLATEARSDATLELLQNASSSDAEALASVGDRYAKTPAGVMARLFEADANLGAGITVLYSDREDAESKIEDAIAAYRDVTAIAGEKLLKSRAYFGLGHALESLGKVDEAITAYRQAIAINESEAIVNAAQHRMDLLLKPETQEFLAWFAKQDFKAADPSEPPSMPGSTALPDLPDLDLPEITPMAVPSELKGDSADGSSPAPGSITLPNAEGTSAELKNPPASNDPSPLSDGSTATPAASTPATPDSAAPTSQPTPATEAVPAPESTPSRESETPPDAETPPTAESTEPVTESQE